VPEFLAARSVPRVPGTAVFLTRATTGVPPLMLWHVQHNRALHERLLVLTVLICRGSPAPSLEAFERIGQSWDPKMRAGTEVNLTVRHNLSLESLGIAGLHNKDAIEAEVGIWIKECQRGYGYGREAVATIVAFVAGELGKQGVLYPVVEQNGPSRRRRASRSRLSKSPPRS
jgi:RimJ/RimL family protein N-acetyltransferase